MPDRPPYPASGDETGVGADHGSAGMPRWVKISLIIAIVLVAAFVVSRLAGVQHGPGLHSPPAGSAGHTSPIGVE